jgi:hypothetical protein
MNPCLEFAFQDVQELITRAKDVDHLDRSRDSHSAQFFEAAVAAPLAWCLSKGIGGRRFSMAGAGRVRSASRGL